MKRLALLLLLALPSLAGAQAITLPPTLAVGKPGLVIITPDKVDGDGVAWTAVDDGLQILPSNLLKDDRVAVGVALAPGTFRVRACCSKVVGGKAALSAFSECLVTVGGVPPGPGPSPGPGPAPGPSPIPLAGFRVLMIEDVANRTKLPAAQLGALFDKSVIDYLNAKCAKGDDGKTPEWRRWDAGTDGSGDEKHWGEAMKLQPPDKAKLPWIVISTGTAGYSGPLPADADKTLELLKKYGG